MLTVVDWENYVTALREEKLRALGVLGDADLPAKSPPTGPRNQIVVSLLVSVWRLVCVFSI